MDYEFVRYSPALKSQLADLRRRVFGGTHALNTAYLEWKYEQNPYLDEPIIHVAMGDGGVVGMRGTYGSQWQFGFAGSRVIPAAADFAVPALGWCVRHPRCFLEGGNFTAEILTD